MSKITQSQEGTLSQTGLEGTPSQTARIPFPTPEYTPPAALLSSAISRPEAVLSALISPIDPEPTYSENNGLRAPTIATPRAQSSPEKNGWSVLRARTLETTWEAAFSAGQLAAPVCKTQSGKIVDRAQLIRFLRSLKRVHRSQLPVAPKRHDELENHLLRQLFIQAEQDHLRSHKDMNS